MTVVREPVLMTAMGEGPAITVPANAVLGIVDVLVRIWRHPNLIVEEATRVLPAIMITIVVHLQPVVVVVAVVVVSLMGGLVGGNHGK